MCGAGGATQTRQLAKTLGGGKVQVKLITNVAARDSVTCLALAILSFLPALIIAPVWLRVSVVVLDRFEISGPAFIY